MRLADRIKAVFDAEGVTSMDTWSLANALYDNCMQRSQPGNGGRIAVIVKAAVHAPDLYREGAIIGLKHITALNAERTEVH